MWFRNELSSLAEVSKTSSIKLRHPVYIHPDVLHYHTRCCTKALSFLRQFLMLYSKHFLNFPICSETQYDLGGQGRRNPDLSTKNSTDLFNHRLQLVTLSSSSSPKTVSFITSHNIPNDAARYRDCKLECYNSRSIALHMETAGHGPHQTLHFKSHARNRVRTISTKIRNFNIYNS